jgi:hypothetical protein
MQQQGPQAAAAAAAREREAAHAAAAAAAPEPAQPAVAAAPAPRIGRGSAANAGPSGPAVEAALENSFVRLRLVCQEAKQHLSRAGVPEVHAVHAEALLAMRAAVERAQTKFALLKVSTEAAQPLSTAPDAFESNSVLRAKPLIEGGMQRKRPRPQPPGAAAADAGEQAEEDAPTAQPAQPFERVAKSPKRRRQRSPAPQPAAPRRAGAVRPAGDSGQPAAPAPPPTADEIAQWPAGTQPCTAPPHGGLAAGRPVLTFAAGVREAVCVCGASWPRLSMFFQKAAAATTTVAPAVGAAVDGADAA